MKKKALSLFALLLSALLVTAACGNGNTPADTSSSEVPASSASTGEAEGYSLPLVTDGSVTLSVAVYENSDTNNSFTNNLPVWKKLEEDTGVKIDWQVTPSGEYAQVMQTRLAAGSDLPDFVNIPSNPMKYISDGLLLPLSEPIEKWGVHTKELYKNNPYIEPFVTTPDGEIYFYTSDVSGAAQADPYVYMIRKDWLDTIGLEEPKTLDDWYNMWKAFVDQDANGNGEKDEIPFTNDNTLIGTTVFGNALGLKLHRSSGWNANEAGVVEYDYVKPEMKELLTWLNKCYAEGLIDKEFSTQTFDTLMKKVTLNQSGSVFRFLNGLPRFNEALTDAGIEGGEFIVVAPPVKDSTSTIKPYVEIYGPTSNLFAFTKDVEDFEIKFKAIDYMAASPEGNYATGFGIEGETYEMVDSKPQFMDSALNSPDGESLNDILKRYGASPTMPWNRSLNGYTSYQAMESIKGTPAVYDAALIYQEYNQQAFPQGTLVTEEEQEIMGQYLTDILTYQDEMITKFIMGTESLENFDTYVENINKLGLEEVLKIRQAQWDRYNS